MDPTEPTLSWSQQTTWTYLGRMSGWPPSMIKVMPRPEKTVRSQIHLNLRNKAPKARSAATMDLPIGCRSLVEQMLRHRLRPISRKLCSSGGNAPMPPFRRWINSTSNGITRYSMEEQKLKSQCTSHAQSTRSLLT
jgi:hypothetical protein